jgi:hypothetical protein
MEPQISQMTQIFLDRINRILPQRLQSNTEAVLAAFDLGTLFPGFFSKRVSAIIPKKDSSRLSPAQNRRQSPSIES